MQMKRFGAGQIRDTLKKTLRVFVAKKFSAAETT